MAVSFAPIPDLVFGIGDHEQSRTLGHFFCYSRQFRSQFILTVVISLNARHLLPRKFRNEKESAIKAER